MGLRSSVCPDGCSGCYDARRAYPPKDLPNPPLIQKVKPADTLILVLAVTSDSLPLTVVDANAQNISPQKISQISGVGLVHKRWTPSCNYSSQLESKLMRSDR